MNSIKMEWKKLRRRDICHGTMRSALLSMLLLCLMLNAHAPRILFISFSVHIFGLYPICLAWHPFNMDDRCEEQQNDPHTQTKWYKVSVSTAECTQCSVEVYHFSWHLHLKWLTRISYFYLLSLLISIRRLCLASQLFSLLLPPIYTRDVDDNLISK